MGDPVLAATRLAGTPGQPALLVAGPSLGTAAAALWGPCAARLAGFEVVAWDLPGHGASPPATGSFTVSALAAAVRALARAAAAGRPAVYAGVSLGGAVAFEIGLEPGPFTAAAALASASRIGDPESWAERARAARAGGTPALVAAVAGRWFAPGFAGRDGATAARLLEGLPRADGESYARACEALATFDRRRDLPAITLPFLFGPGEHDVVVPPARAVADAAAVPAGRVHTFTGCGHLPPAEDPGAVAAALGAFFAPARRSDEPGVPIAAADGAPGREAGS